MNIRIDSDVATTNDLLQLEIRLTARFDQLASRLDQLETRLMATLDEVLAIARQNRQQIAALNAKLDENRQIIMEILAGAQLAPAVQAKVDKLLGEVAAEGQDIADTITENPPIVPPTPPEPTP